MKRTHATLAMSVLITICLITTLHTEPASAQTGYTIQNVNHQIQLLSSAHILITETITLTGQTGGTFLIGYPYKYGNHILKGIAYDQNGSLPLNIGVQLGNRSGFYGAEITLPTITQTETFTVAFILNNDLVTEGTAGNSVDFPAYPSLTQDAAQCTVTLTLPPDAASITVSKDDGTVNATTYTKENLPAFTNSPAIVTFTAQSGEIQQIDFTSLNRAITVDPAGALATTDTFRITNKSPNLISTIHLDIPTNVTNLTAKDEAGRTLSTTITPETDQSGVNVAMQSSINTGQAGTITLQYSLPNAPAGQTSSFTFNLDLFQATHYYIDNASVEITLPEGAHFVAPTLATLEPSMSVNRQLFQENLQINRQAVSSIDNLFGTENILQISYDYNILWLSFRPTFWVWGLFIAGSIIYTIWRRPKIGGIRKTAVPRLSAGLSPDNVRAFTETYEERRNITHEIRLLHARVQKGKIPRNYYKSQRKTLETRLTALTKNINQLKGTFRAAGGKYADLIRQLDTAENELDKARTTVRTAEASHRTGEMPIEEYKKALTDYQQKKEKIELQINGILLRLREEIH
jgi:hypothetical protein